MDIKKVTKDRLQGWEKVCNDTNSTPQVLITLNPKSSQIGVVITDGIKVEYVKGLLLSVLNSL